MLRILHTGDVHLDSPFTQLDLHRAEIRQNELRGAFTSMMTWARMNQVDLLLVAGDLFDHAYVTRETVELLTREFGKLPCPVVIAPGNHDCDGEKSLWGRNPFPANVHVFHRDTLEKISFDELGTDVYGYAFTGPELLHCPIAGARVPNDGRIHLLLAHADLLSKTSRSAPVTAGEIEAFGADWSALGHIHNPPPLQLAPDGSAGYGYCGCLEGRGPDERGPKGAVLVEIETGGDAEGARRKTVRARRIRFSRRRYETDEVSLTGVTSMAAAEERVRELIAARKYGEDTILTLRLTGRTEPAFLLRAEALEGGEHGLFALRVRDETEPETAGSLAADPTVRGEFYRLLAPRMESGTEEERRLAARALRCGLAALAGESITDY